LKNLFRQANDIGHAIPCIDIKDSIREVNSDNNKAIDRSKLKAIQTPQTFKIPLIKHAFSQPYKDSFTDEASVLESIGERINLVDGLEKNIKITKPLDLKIASLFLKE
jgi:2-C-methyl-D-erythritol 4-phosphate cytidylyltransferase